MHRQTKKTAISASVKRAVFERDGGRCVLCGRTYGAFPNAHFIGRAHGGLGIEENILTLCIPCHIRYDNSEERPALRELFAEYLASRYDGWKSTRLTYDKYDGTGRRMYE